MLCILPTLLLFSALWFPQETIAPVPINPPFVQLLPDVSKPIPNFDQEVLIPLKATQEKADQEKAAAEAEAARIAALPKPVYVPYVAPRIVSGELTGSMGYILGGNNCVDTARAYGKLQSGNPSSWYITGHTPFIGAAALFYFNHVAIVVGIWSNGDVELAQSNYQGTQHRFSQAEIRGYF